MERRLPQVGFRVLPGQGTYFLVADFRPLLPVGAHESDVDFCRRLTVDVGVTLIPVRRRVELINCLLIEDYKFRVQ